jgi:hypothetical protein
MPIVAKEPESKFTPAPEGLHQAVCCDVWNPWTEVNKFHGGLTEKTRIVWQIDQVNEETGKPFEVSQVYTLSLHEKANLCKHLVAWRGKPFTEEERMGFDLEKLIGVNCQLQVVHNLAANGKTYANVQAIVPINKNMTKLRVSDGFVRHKDRKPNAPGAPPSSPDDDSDSVPF